MILILAGREDTLAAEVAARLGKEACILDWPAVRFAGDTIEGGEPSAVLVRSLPPLAAGDDTDEAYLQQEWYAAAIGLLGNLPCRVINRPYPLRTFRWPHAFARQILAAGFHLPEVSFTTGQTLAGARSSELNLSSVVGRARGPALQPAVVTVVCGAAFPEHQAALNLAASLNLDLVTFQIAEGNVLTAIEDIPSSLPEAPFNHLCDILAGEAQS